MSDGDLVVEATGETIGEAKWAALRELERKQPGLDKAAVRFEVVSEGERGLLGVGYEPARVLAQLPADAIVVGPPQHVSRDGESELAADVRGLVERVVQAIGVGSRVETSEDAETLSVAVAGDDLGPLIGRHGQTIDAIQYLLNTIVYRGYGDARKEVVLDAAGYRARRRETLEELAVESAERALRDLARVELEPMTAIDRKVVHLRLQDYDGVETTSEGAEPNRYVVVSPTR
jgi:spoIIIJ-associated protein